MSVKYCFMGEIPNEEVLDFYKNNSVDCFITTSSTEGLPVSIMEAMSYGIPIVATDVGGVEELIKHNGYLLSADTDSKEVAAALEKVLFCETAKKTAMRHASRELWDCSFNSKKNANKFISELQHMFPKRKKIILVTNGYPLGGEKSFIQDEIRELVRFYNVTIIALVAEQVEEPEFNRFVKTFYHDIEISETDTNCVIVRQCVMKWDTVRSIPFLVKYFFDPRISIEKRIVSGMKKKKIANVWGSMKYYAYSERFYHWMCKQGLLDDISSDTIIYTYWYLYTTLALCINKDLLNGVKLISRAHGYDLYNERVSKINRQPFREMMNTRLDGLFFVSNKGLEYYVSHWGAIDKKKLSVAYLGSKDHDTYCVENNYSDKYRIVSCSHLIPLKRVEVIVEALELLNDKYPKCQFEWIHFGDGYLRNDIEKYANERLGKIN